MDYFRKHDHFDHNNAFIYSVISVVAMETTIGAKTLCRRKRKGGGKHGSDQRARNPGDQRRGAEKGHKKLSETQPDKPLFSGIGVEHVAGEPGSFGGNKSGEGGGIGDSVTKRENT